MKLGIQIPSYYTEQNMFSLAILFIEKHIFVYWQSPDHHLDHHLAQFVHTASIGSTQGEAEQISMPVNAVHVRLPRPAGYHYRNHLRAQTLV